MKKTLLTERFQQLAGIKPLYTEQLGPSNDQDHTEEIKAPNGWTEIKDLSDMHYSEEDGEIAVKAWDAPMEGWDEKNKDIIVVRKEDDKFYLDGYVPFGDFEMQGPFNTYEEVFKLAVEEMEAFKEDWDEQ